MLSSWLLISTIKETHFFLSFYVRNFFFFSFLGWGEIDIMLVCCCTILID
ncbi:hypothetical protein RchiOBHm_Chr7g0238431 [Rosa chinensis]|uniref:Uncharacterized protein n=1 Tax=Rosa chinensis TaxID=74649 RepID=A0A2P6PHH7_ROSCH|nr:hypothetical protein RchiOBHm_Chr7g0238431 [Rosa chinensis]